MTLAVPNESGSLIIQQPNESITDVMKRVTIPDGVFICMNEMVFAQMQKEDNDK